ncbi:hypothetical protein ACOMHN_061309 [Nucella lapillus]
MQSLPFFLCNQPANGQFFPQEDLFKQKWDNRFSSIPGSLPRVVHLEMAPGGSPGMGVIGIVNSKDGCEARCDYCDCEWIIWRDSQAGADNPRASAWV